VKVFSGKDLHLIGSFYPFGARYRGPLTVTSGDVDADGHADIIVARGAVARVFDGETLAPVDAVRIPAYRTRAGYTLSAPDVNRDGFSDLVVRRRNGSIRSIDGHSLTHRRALRSLAQHRRDLARQVLGGARR
jgi:hypothetical protein